MFKDYWAIRNYHAYRNKIKNELKQHSEERNEDVLIGNFRQIALPHIAWAVQNFKMTNNYLPKDKIIKDSCFEIGIF